MGSSSSPRPSEPPPPDGRLLPPRPAAALRLWRWQRTAGTRSCSSSSPCGVASGSTGGPAPRASALLSILLAHEMGHYLACRYYGSTRPCPSSSRSPAFEPRGHARRLHPHPRPDSPSSRPLRHRRRGPARRFRGLPARALAGRRSRRPCPRLRTGRAASPSASPCSSSGRSRCFAGSRPDGQTLMMGPLGLAAWFGLLVTALNMMPSASSTAAT